MSKICIFCGHEYEDNEPKCPYCSDRIDSADKVRNRKLRSNFSFGPALSFGGNSRSKAIIIIIAIVLVIALVAGSLLLLTARKTVAVESDVEEMRLECPNFVGKTVDEINDRYKNKDIGRFSNLNIEFEYEPNDEYEEDVVFKQSVEAGEYLSGFQKITLYVSTGPELRYVPHVKYEDVNYAITLIEDSGFVPNVVYETNNDYANGTVIWQSPDSGDEMPYGSTVTILVAENY